MNFDDHLMFEKYLYSLVEAKMPKGTPRPDVILNRYHTQKTTIKHNPDAPESHGGNIGRNTGLTPSQSDRIRDVNFARYVSEDINGGHYIEITGEDSDLPEESKRVFVSLVHKNPNNNFFKYVVDSKLVIPYWMVPDCIESFTSSAKIESNRKIKNAYIDALILMYRSLTDKTTYKLVYRNSKPILKFTEEGKSKKVFEISDTYEEFISKIESRIKTLIMNPQVALMLKQFLFKNHTKPRQQVKFGEDRYEDAMFVHSPGSGEHSIFNKEEEEPSHSYDMFDPTDVSKRHNITDRDLEKIHIKDEDQSRRTPNPLASFTPEINPKRKKRKIKESLDTYIENILF